MITHRHKLTQSHDLGHKPTWQWQRQQRKQCAIQSTLQQQQQLTTTTTNNK